MAIQISEKLLSEKAKVALNKASSKSQFLRDAVEFYVNSIDPHNQDTFCIQGVLINEIKELKKMLDVSNVSVIKNNSREDNNKSTLNISSKIESEIKVKGEDKTNQEVSLTSESNNIADDKNLNDNEDEQNIEIPKGYEL